MKLSIVTINYNNANGLKATIESIVSQSYKDFEYIVIDGGSKDKSAAVIEEEYADKINYWVSEPDSGVYNAMNKGIKQAKGEYLLFINSGDKLVNKDVLAEVFSQNIETDLIYGNLQRVYEDGHTDIVKMPEHVSIQHMLGDTLAHPVTFIRRSLFEKYGLYREDLRIVADWAFFLKIIAFGRITQKHIPFVITEFQTNGMSNNSDNASIMAEETEKVLKDYFSLELLDICTSYDKYYNFYHGKLITRLRQINYAIRKSLSIEGWKDFIYQKRINWLISLSNKRVREQKKDPLSIPIIIISYNRLDDLRRLVSFLLKRKHKNIIIVDNKSTYPPLLAYYEEMKEYVTVKIMDKNYGHLVFWKNRKLYSEYAGGYHIITDSDIIPNENLPDDYLNRLLSVLDKNKNVSKVGFALRIDDMPDSFKQKETVLKWEKQFWENPIESDVYKAGLDTTFAIYPPKYQYLYDNFYNAIRIGGNFTARHGGWYVDSEHMTDEEKFYFKTSNASNSWKLDEHGQSTGDPEYTNQ